MKVIVSRDSQEKVWLITEVASQNSLETSRKKVYLRDCKFNESTIEGELITEDEAYTNMSCDYSPRAVSFNSRTDSYLVFDFEQGLKPITEAPMLFLDDLILLVKVK